jgi:RsiW-degrading membrane proteinase PrsW (M82 family)
MLSAQATIAFLGGVLPALLWLIFWLLEDRRHPEPKQYIFLCFIVGMALVIPVSIGGHVYGLAQPIEKLAAVKLGPIDDAVFPYWWLRLQWGPFVIFAWAAIEELLKFGAAYLVALKTKQFDEPLDAIIYMVTVALGFSAAENMLFLIPAIQQSIPITILTGDLRFIGATMLHTLASATIGIALALSFYENWRKRALYVSFGLVLAIALHTLFNFFIMLKVPAGCAGKECHQFTFWIFLTIWLGIIAILLGLEQIKRPKPKHRYL